MAYRPAERHAAPLGRGLSTASEQWLFVVCHR
jgi:hypothetical protein